MISAKSFSLNKNVNRGSQGVKKVALQPVNAIAERFAAQADTGKPYFNMIPKNGKWPKGIPPVMGGHLMDSGVVSPISVSKGAGIDITPHQFQYPAVEGEVALSVVPSKSDVPAAIANIVVESAKAAIAAKGSFTLVVSGGSLPEYFTTLSQSTEVAWDKVFVFFVDERNVPHASEDSTFRAVKASLFSKVPIPASNIFAILEDLTTKEAAINYEGRLLQISKSILPRGADGVFPVFDLVLLGIGPDGHIASLFPNRPEVSAVSGWVLPVEASPKPPSARITMTLPVINAAKDVVIVALGKSKAEIVERVLEIQSLPGALPAQLVRPSAGKLQWLLDTEAAKNLHIKDWSNSKLYPRSG